MSKISETELRQRLEVLAGVEPSPEAARRALERVRQSILESDEEQARKSIWRILMENKWSRVAVAAAVLLAVAIGLNVFTPWGGGVAWSQLIENVRQARSCIHRMQMTISRTDRPDVQYEFTLYGSSGHGIRRDAYQRGKLVSQMYVSGNAEDCVEIVHDEKKYVKAKFTEKQFIKMRDKNDPRELVKLLMDFEHTELGTRQIRGHQCEGIEVNDPHFGRMFFEKGIGRLWADIATDLPVLMEFEGTSSEGSIRTRITLDEFRWDPELTASDFEPNIPADYSVMAEVDLSPGDETAVKALGAFSKITGGRYPSALSVMTAMNEVQTAFTANRRRQGISLEQEPTKEELSDLIAIQGTCLHYGHLMNDGNDAAYYGKTVTAEFPHAVLMRWKCGRDKYRVILGDLTVRDATPEELTRLEAMPLNMNAYAIEPEPADGTVGLGLDDLPLKWLTGATATEHKLHFGTDPNDLPLLATTTEPQYVDLPELERGTTYFWHVDEVNADGSVTPGSLWSFSTGKLVARWKLDEGTGTVVTDAGGHGPGGVLVGDPAWVQGVDGGALELDGDGDYVDLGTAAEFDIVDRITLVAWIKVNAFTVHWQTIIAKGDTAWRLGRSQGNNLHFACTGLWPEWVHGAANVNDGQWHHVAGVYDGDEIRLYVDGELDASARTQGTINVNAYPVRIGENAEEPRREWNGLIDDVRLYNYALSETEITTLHEAAR